MDSKAIKTDAKHLLKTRQEFSQWSKQELNKWQTNKELKEKKRLEELQNQEIEAISRQLADLRQEYERITKQRGSAHKWALLMAQQELESNQALRRKEIQVSNRSKRVFRDFVDENIFKEINSKIDKRYEMVRRKQLMKSQISSEDKLKRPAFDRLEDTKKLAKREKNSGKNSNFKHVEREGERKLERRLEAKKTVPKQGLLRSYVSTRGPNQSPRRIMKKVITKTDDKHNGLKSTETKMTKESKTFSDDSEEDLPIEIAIKLYDKLKIHRCLGNESHTQKLYKNAAICTTPSLSRRNSLTDIKEVENCSVGPEVEDSIDNDTIERVSVVSSLQTTYMSVPNTAEPSNRVTVGWNELCKKFLTIKESQSEEEINSEDTSAVDNTQELFDPLMCRINNLKELIDRNVMQRNEDKLSSGDSPALVQSDETEKQVRQTSFEDTQLQKDFSVISSSSSATFKTLPVVTSGRNSPSDGSWLQKSIDLSQVLPSHDLNDNSVEIDSMSSSFVGQPLRDRNAFWKEVFERAGIDIDVNQIDDFIGSQRAAISTTNSDSFASFTLSSLSSDHNLHSTPKH